MVPLGLESAVAPGILVLVQLSVVVLELLLAVPPEW